MSNPHVNFPPAPPAQPPGRPTNALHVVAGAVGSVVGAPGRAVEMLNQGFASLTNSISQALPCFPAATQLSIAFGAPHAHNLHPPSGPNPIPIPVPILLPPIGPVMFGNCVSVLVNGKPAARCGDLGIGPTCCGLPPIYEVFTGSSKVFIGGARAARQCDITYHCKPVPPAGAAARGAAAALAAAMKTAMIAGMAAQVASIAGDTIEAGNPENSPAMQAAMGMSAGVAAAQMANDLVAMAMGALMGKDVCIPPGTPGAIMANTSPNVLIGGFPMPSWMAIARGLLKLVKGLAKRIGRGRGKAHEKPCGSAAQPINLMTGAFFDQYLDYELQGPIPLVWKRYYDSRWVSSDGPFGWGFRHEYQYSLRATLDGFDLVTCDNETVSFPPLEDGADAAARDGLLLRKLDQPGEYAVEEAGQPTMVFSLRKGQTEAPLRFLRRGDDFLEFLYTKEGRLVEIRDSLERLTRILYDEHGHILKLKCREPGAAEERVLASYSYERGGLLVRWTDALHHNSTYVYDDHRRMIRRTNRRGYTFFNEYDEQGRCTREYGEDGLWDARVKYMPEALCAVATYADGATLTVFYNENHIPTEVIRPSGGKVVFEMDDEGRVVKERDPLGSATHWLYDGWGGNTGRLTPQGHFLPRMDIEPNPPDPLAYELPETPLEWEHGQLLDPTAIQPLSPDDSLLRPSLPIVYNAVLGFRGWPQSADHEPNGSGATKNQPRRVFDAMGRVVEEVDDNGKIQRWKYDPEGNVIEHQDRDGSVWRSVYKSWNLLHQKIAPTGGVTTYEYNLRMEVTRVTDPHGTLHEYIYDAWDRLVEIRRHGRVKERYRYDLADNLIEKTDGQGRPILKLKFAAGNLVVARELAHPQHQSVSSNGQAPSGMQQVFEHDEAGRITRAATDTLEATFAYDEYGHLLVDHRDGVGVDHTFVAGDLAETRYFDRFQVSYERLDASTLKIKDPTGAVHYVKISQGGLIVRDLSSGATELARYDVKGRCLFKAGTDRWEEQPRWILFYRYSAEGDLRSVENIMDGTTLYEYDNAHRLRREFLPEGTVREFRYDLADNLLKQPGLTDVEIQEGNRLRTANGEVFEYNDRNHIASRQGPGKNVRYKYDAMDLLTACDIDGERWTARYDPLCRRVSKTWRGQATTYYWDRYRLATEEKAHGSLRIYIYVDHAALVPFMFIEYENRKVDPASGARYYIFTNQIGAPVRVEDDWRNVIWKARIDPYGQAHMSSESDCTMSLRFPGHHHDTETGLHCNRFRYYDPILARYIQCDPIGIVGGLNLYAYSSKPLAEVDLDGLSKKPHDVEKPKEPEQKEPALIYEASPKHGRTERGTAMGVSSTAPLDGQAALNNSVQVKPTSPRRVGVDKANTQIVVFDQTHPNQPIYHGHVREWGHLTQEMQTALVDSGKVTRRGRIL